MVTWEKEVQGWLVNLIESGTLLERIAGVKELDTALEGSESENFIPTFQGTPFSFQIRKDS
jgi:hypothetical protein